MANEKALVIVTRVDKSASNIVGAVAAYLASSGVVDRVRQQFLHFRARSLKWVSHHVGCFWVGVSVRPC